MLVLTRRTSDQILIPSLGITLEVLSIKGNVVKIGISAPQEVRILRGELEGTEPGFAKAKSSEPIEKESRKRSGSLKAYLQRSERQETTGKPVSPANAASRSASLPVLFLPEESSEVIRETTASYEVCT